MFKFVSVGVAVADLKNMPADNISYALIENSSRAGPVLLVPVAVGDDGDFVAGGTVHSISVPILDSKYSADFEVSGLMLRETHIVGNVSCVHCDFNTQLA